MSREGDALRKCPTCQTPVENTTAIGMRDFSWVNRVLPGNVGGMDVDFFINQARTERGLVLELKPKGARLTTGARLTFALLRKKGFDVWVVWDLGDGQVRVAVLDTAGNEGQAWTCTQAELARHISAWWYDGLQETWGST
jgi:hypothetical protein